MSAAARAAARDLLVEIGTEELPPKSLPALSQAFTDGIVAGLDAAALKHGAAQSYATPRRLAVLVRRVADRQPEQQIRRRGPPLAAAFDASGAPTRAAAAFAESCGTTVAALGRVTEPKGEFLHYSGAKSGAATSALLPGIVQAALDRLPIAKRMRWGSGSAEFVRPVHWVVLLHGRDVVPATILGVAAGNATRGHRFMAPRAFTIARPASYAQRLEDRGRVVADFATRRERIRAGVLALAHEHGVEALVSEALLDEVAALVEWPVPVAGRFEERFLALPPEVLVATLQDHQRCFPTRRRNAEGGGTVASAGAGALAPLFIAVSNLESRDPAQVRAGNERVVRPRLADAAFFWDADRAQRLADRREALEDVTFQAQLGSYRDKAERVKALALRLAGTTLADAAHVARAADIARCDLLTGLVGEFPELQGTMGAYYARHDGEPAEVAAAIGEQYLPRFAGDALPATAVGTTLALADRIDTIAGIFAIGQKPSGTKDPFALRRAALGWLRIVLEQRLEVDLPRTIDAALAAVRADIARRARERAAAAAAAGAQAANGGPAIATPGATTPAAGPADVASEIYDYVMERLRAYFLEADAGITTGMFDAVLEKRPASPLDFEARLRALAAFLALPDAAALAAANKRIANMLRQAGGADARALDAGLLQQAEERALYAALEDVRPEAERLLDVRDYGAALQRLARLRPAVDAFFDSVMVMAEDDAVRANRLALLARVRELFLRVADLSRLPG